MLLHLILSITRKNTFSIYYDNKYHVSLWTRCGSALSRCINPPYYIRMSYIYIKKSFVLPDAGPEYRLGKNNFKTTQRTKTQRVQMGDRGEEGGVDSRKDCRSHEMQD